MVGAIGFEPMTPSMSPKCSTAELRARIVFDIMRYKPYQEDLQN